MKWGKIELQLRTHNPERSAICFRHGLGYTHILPGSFGELHPAVMWRAVSWNWEILWVDLLYLHVFCRFWVEVWNGHTSLKGPNWARLMFSRGTINIYDQIELLIENGFSLRLRLRLPPPKNGEIALWPNTCVVKCKYCVSQKQNEANDKAQWYNVFLTFVS